MVQTTLFLWCYGVQLSVIIKTPRETDFLMDIPLNMPLLQYGNPGLHDISPFDFYSNFSRLNMQHFELPEFDSYKTFDSKFTPSYTGSHAILLTATFPVLVASYQCWSFELS